jgi:hypothetical protein
MRILRAICAVLVLALSIACGDSTSPTVPAFSQLLGSWTVTSLLLTAYADPQRQREALVPGIAIDFSFSAPDQFARVDSFGGRPPALVTTDSGVAVLIGDSLAIVPRFNPPYSFTRVRLQGNQLEWGDSAFGTLLDPSGPAEAYRIHWVLRKQ